MLPYHLLSSRAGYNINISVTKWNQRSRELAALPRQKLKTTRRARLRKKFISVARLKRRKIADKQGEIVRKSYCRCRSVASTSTLVSPPAWRRFSATSNKHHKRRSSRTRGWIYIYVYMHSRRAKNRRGDGFVESRERARRAQMELTKDRREEIAGRKTPTWRDSNAASASERDFHSPLLLPPLCFVVIFVIDPRHSPGSWWIAISIVPRHFSTSTADFSRLFVANLQRIYSVEIFCNSVSKF